MDPDVALANVRGLVTQANAVTDETSQDMVAALLEELCVAVVTLDGWLTGGGLGPAAWRHANGSRLRACGHEHEGAITELLGVDGSRPLVSCPSLYGTQNVLERSTPFQVRWTWADPTWTGEGAERDAFVNLSPMAQQGEPLSLNVHPQSAVHFVDSVHDARRTIQGRWAIRMPVIGLDGEVIGPVTPGPVEPRRVDTQWPYAL